MKQSIIFLALLIMAGCSSPNQEVNQQTAVIPNLPRTMCAPQFGQALNMDDDKTAPLFTDLTNGFHYPITTRSAKAQQYFNQGMVLAMNFNHAEAARSFRQAALEDPGCAMALWGSAYVLGPNYNAGMEPEVYDIATKLIQDAKPLFSIITPKEKDLIEAMTMRYPPNPSQELTPESQDYADAMEKLAVKYPEDLTLAGLYAESLMDLHPWDLWQKNGNPQPWTPQVIKIIKDILAKDDNNAVAHHLYIHAVEASQTPELGLVSARKLPTIFPEAGHLVHMPSHIYIRSGHYHEGTLANKDAIIVDSVYVSACHAAGAYPLAYFPHNYHFLAATAAFEGDGFTAIDAAKKMVDALDTDLMKEPGWGTIQHYYSIPWYVQVKFARWDDILKEARPDEELKYPLAIWHYARGMAYSAKNNLDKAQLELVALKNLALDESIKDLSIWDINSCLDLVKIAELVLEGDMLFRKGEYGQSTQLLAAAVEMEDALNYNEPPDWFFSVRHHLGNVLLSAKKYEAAETLYRKDLELFPETGFALNGLYESLLKQDKRDQAEEIQKRFEKAWQWADSALEGSLVKSVVK
jgi:tetratricopeptide (TPR) repeat protein